MTSVVILAVTALVLLGFTNGEDPYRFFTWNVSYGDIYPLGVKQQVIYLLSSSPFFTLF